jgi:hypothetical protein
MRLFESPDPMERDYLKVIVHRLYSRFVVLRGPIRRLITKSLLVGLAEDQ